MSGAEESDARMGLVYDEALRSIAQQQASVEALRSRVGTLLSAASISTAFLGAQALANRTPGQWGLLAMVSFVAVVGVSIAIMWPYEWIFRRSPKAILREYIDHNEPLVMPAIQRDLALHLEDHYDRNERKLNRLLRVFEAGCAVLALEVVAWLVELRRR